MRTVSRADVVHDGAAVGSTATSSNPPSAWPGPQRPAVDRDALAHADEPVPAGGVDAASASAPLATPPPTPDAGPVVDDLEPHGIAVVGDHDSAWLAPFACRSELVSPSCSRYAVRSTPPGSRGSPVTVTDTGSPDERNCSASRST